ncbi:efflux RND transporter periplasmic adaptor subunit [Salegentibacter salegens]|uniref:RND family efflux transporter, MFP subunit n=1 Tax=Salegentibacter salegens TaxID=143223 RepID=A0A1M7HLN9_9FLAO|nr:efflux RND transporter periplasmic adaptor subunit [Salegentibacter salegens]PRX39455.1 RND family efflux transporter MFP subunit [Salegentibacter salegens]SHM29359.1 RND family efflux transporter, MFP subunit [Salegentibacter salegens]
MKYLYIACISLFLLSCGNNEEEDHAHDAEGNHVSSGVPAINKTIWTDQTELFVEFPALVEGRTSKFAAHFTVLDKHQPVREGSVTVSLIKEETGIRHKVDSPSSPGIFSPALQPKEPGTYDLVFDLKTPEYSDRIVIKDIQVYASAAEASENVAEAEDGGISFLKEQAWKIDFQTEPVTKGEVYDVVHTSGVWQAAPGTYKTLAAGANGMVNFVSDNLTEGTEVKKGQLLMNLSSEGLSSNNVQAEIAQAKARYDQAKAEYERKKELYEDKIVPKAEFEKVESDFRVAEANYRALGSNYGAGGKQIRAPFDGFIKSISTSNGSYVEQGANLVTIGTDRSRLLKTQLSASNNPTKESIANVWYRSDNGDWNEVEGSGSAVISVGKEVEDRKPMIPVYIKVEDVVEMPEGSFTEVQIALGEAKTGVVVPEAALLEDYGNYSVIVQTGGESFERRPVKIGKRNGKKAQVLSGLEDGEVVVTTGFYQVKMASMSGTTPAHGHDH